MQSKIEKIAGVDYSMNSPALCIHPKYNSLFLDSECKFIIQWSSKGSNGEGTRKKFIVKEDPSFSYYLIDARNYHENTFKKFYFMAESIVDILIKENVTSVNIEGYSYASTGLVYEIGENIGTFKSLCHKNSIDINITEPSKLKKFATKYGNANKHDMYDVFANNSSIRLDTVFGLSNKTKEIREPATDVVDSYFLCKKLFQDIHASIK